MDSLQRNLVALLYIAQHWFCYHQRSRFNGFVDGSGNAELFATTGATATSVIGVTDTGAGATG